MGTFWSSLYQNWEDSHEVVVEAGVKIRSTRSIGSIKLDKEVDERNKIKFAHITTDHSINRKIGLYKGDITTMNVDAIVNAARPSLLGGGGIDKAIHAAAGPQLVEACRPLNGCKHGETKVTQGFNLICKYVLHTVGPNRDLHTAEESEPLLQRSYRQLRVLEYKIRSVALSCVSTGAYRYPNREAAHVALSTVRKWLEAKENLDRVDLILFNVFLDEDMLHYAELMPLYFPVK